MDADYPTKGVNIPRRSTEDSFGRIFLAVGGDILPVAQAQPTLADVAASIAATEEAWIRGEIVMQPWRGTEVQAGD